ncbi:MAG: hypothetical protein ACOYM3_15750 [Terrimicrobiaceae bacterium]
MRYPKKYAKRLAAISKNDITPRLNKWGRSAALAAACGCHRQAIYKWFSLCQGRPPAEATLLALRWSEEISRKQELRYFPSWEDFRERARVIILRDNLLSEVSRFCEAQPAIIEHYLLNADRAERRPDGEFALAVFDWFQESRIAYRRLPERLLHPDIKKVFEDESSDVTARVSLLRRPHRLDFQLASLKAPAGAISHQKHHEISGKSGKAC